MTSTSSVWRGMLARPVLVLILLAVLSLSMTAQQNAGIIAGSVLDPTGAGVDGATVVAMNTGTGGVYEAKVSGGGNYRIPDLLVGTYDVSVTAPGFQTTKQTGVTVLVGTTTPVNFNLVIGSVSESVTVSAGVTNVQSESSDVGTVIENRQVIELPLALGGVGAMRSPEAFMFLAPGVVGPGTANSNNGVFLSKTGGGQNFGNEVLLDGASILRTENGSSFDEAAPSVEAIREFKILTSTLPAEYDRTTGGVETFVLKSGTNEFHGTGYLIYKNDKFNANPWFNNAYGASRPVDHKRDYGTNLGGPVIIPKLWDGRKRQSYFFFNWEQYKEHFGATTTSTVLTDAERQGDFSAFLTNDQLGTNPCDGTPIYSGQIFDPATTKTGSNGVQCRTAFSGNKIPLSRFSDVSKNFLTYMPTANQAGVVNANGTVASNYIFSVTNPLYNTTYQIRIDQNITDNHKIYASYHSRENTRYAGQQIAPATIDSGGWPQDFITHYGRFGWTWTISPTMMNNLNIGYNRTNSKNVTSAVSEATSGGFSWASKLGIQNITGVAGHQFPNMGMGESILYLGRGNQDDNIDNGERLNEQLSWFRGKHQLAFGIDWRNQLYSTFGYGADSGFYNFGRAQTAAIQSLNKNTGNGIASFLLGDLSDSGRQITGHVGRWIAPYFAWFIKDDIKIRPDLTINLGLRWNLDVPRHESYDNTSNFDPNLPNSGAGGHLGALAFGNKCNGCNPKWADTYHKAWSPRIGAAWVPQYAWLKKRAVVRGGYGIYYSPLQYTDFGGNMQQGFTAQPRFASSDGFSSTFNWDSGFPNVTLPPSYDPTQKNGQSAMDYMKPEYGQPGRIQSWTVQVQYQLTKDMIATLGYVGQHSDSLRSAIDNVNNIPWAKTALGDQLYQDINGNTAGVQSPYAGFQGNVAQALRPWPQYQWIYTDVLQNRGFATYNSLQATLERRFAAGLQTQLSFSWQKTVTDADSILPGINAGVTQVQQPQDLSLERALSMQDVPVMFTASWLYELPFGKGKRFVTSGIPAAILGGWQLGGVQRYQSGVPTTFCGASGIPGWDQCIRFDYVPGQSVRTSAATGSSNDFDPFKDRQFNVKAFADPNAGRTGNEAFRLGNMPRTLGNARSWGYINEDFAIIRNVHLYERFTIQIKGELLNAFNRHVFASGNNNPNDPNFGLVTGTIDTPRQVQFTMRVNF